MVALFAACKEDDNSGGTGADSDSGVTVSELYSVTVNGQPLTVTRMDRFDRVVQFVRFDLAGPSNVSITPGTGTSIATYTLSPERLGIQSTVAANTISFTATQPAYLILSPDTGERLFILMDPPENAPPNPNAANVINVGTLPGVDNTGATSMTTLIQGAIDSASTGAAKTVYVPEGIYQVGELWMRDNMTLYLADGAILQVPAKFSPQATEAQREAQRQANLAHILTADESGSAIEGCLHAVIRMNGVTNSHLKGRGIIDGSGSYLRHNVEMEDYDSQSKYNLLKIEDSNNCSVDGVMTLDTAFWNTIVYRSDQISITNYKVINNRPGSGWNETDGVDFNNATNSVLSNAFLYTGDDCMATKSDDIADDYVYPELEEGQNYPLDPTVGEYISVDNLRHEKVVCFTNQAACKIGTKTMGADFGNVTFDQIDVLKCGRGLVVDAMDTARVHDIFFSNVTFEYVTTFTPVIYNITGGTDWRYSEGIAQVENIFAENIYLNDFEGDAKIDIKGRIGDEPVMVPDTDSDTSDTETGVMVLPEYPIGAVKFTNFVVNGVRVTPENVDETVRLGARVADDITIE